MKAIISGGGTGGHIFPAIAIAQAIEKAEPSEILFVGASGKMEMNKVPEAGYNIVGLPIRGIQRKLSLSNLKVPFLLLFSLWKAFRTIRKFKPDVVVGVGGYASAAVVYVASLLKIPTLIQEQNSYPGVTNKILGKKVDKICVAFEGMDQFFPMNKIELTGNPIRKDILNKELKATDARRFFNLDPNKTTLLCIGGSLGAKTLNTAMLQLVDHLEDLNIQLLWQCGKFYYEIMHKRIPVEMEASVRLLQFIPEMDKAYAAADMVISRAGALSISEITALEKTAILIPSPNVSEDHQTKNARALIESGAAILLKDEEAERKIVELVKDLIQNPNRIAELQENIKKVFSNSNAADDIAKTILKLSQGQHV